MITIESSGSFKRTDSFLNRLLKRDIYSSLYRNAEVGVNALSNATPLDSGLTSASWYAEVIHNANQTSIVWKNTNVVNGFPVAVMLQYGHGTGTGGYVEGRDYINPAIKPIFDKIAEDVWREVTSA